MTGEVEAVPTDKASRIKARKASMTAGDPTSERKGTREGPGRSFRTPSAEVQQYTTWNMDMNMDMDMDMEDGMNMDMDMDMDMEDVMHMHMHMHMCVL